ncbi:MAG: NUDIX hydrolase N-terminal domain-containing protein [Clostridium sp.]|uniref:NUDIX hydrolase N-terminal domain-containing protein n=1 Tax=Clostridium sp. TaxID=1506 RepID=UPI003F2F1B0B
MNNKLLREPWLQWAMEIQSIAQAGLAYGKDVYDIERYERIREISAEMISYKTEIPVGKVKELFCNEKGYQTPKLDTRAAIFKDDEILLVKENNGAWSMPGGWVDVLESIESNTVKEVQEEAGILVQAERIIAIQDRNKHNKPIYPYGVCKVFVQCRKISGEFKENIETIESKYFSLENLPKELANEKNTKEQIKMCFEAKNSKIWETIFD